MISAPERVSDTPERVPEASGSIRITITVPRELNEWLLRVAETRAVPRAILIRMLLLTCRERDYAND